MSDQLEVFDTHPSPTLIVDARSHQVLKANRASAAHLGASPETLREMPLTQLTPENAIPDFGDRAFAEEAVASRHILIRLQPPGQAPLHVHSHWLPATIGGDPVLIVSWQPYAALNDGEDLTRYLRELLASVPDPFFILATCGDILVMNDATREICIEGTETGDCLWTHLRDDSSAALHLACERSAEKPGTRATEEFTLHGRVLEVNCYRSENGLVFYLRDVSELREAEAALRLSAERLDLVARATNDAIWDVDIESGVTWWSNGLFSQFGHDPAMASTEPGWWLSQLHPDDRERVQKSLQVASRSHVDHWQQEYRFRNSRGDYAFVLDRGFIMSGDNGDPVRMIGSMLDLTERRAMEERLRQAHKMEAVGQLTGGVAHDFNNLLTVIIGNADLMAEQLEDDSALREIAELTASAAQRGAELTHRLLAFSRRQPLEPRHVDLNRLIAGMDSLLRRTLEEHIEIELVRGAGLWIAHVDPAQLEAALLNLAINARDAMPGGGRLTIETANVNFDENYAGVHDEVIAGQYVLVSMSDNGAGINPASLPQVFEPFFTTKTTGKGSGLGLSMVYGFAKQSGGHINIYSEPGEGTTVKLYLPRSHRSESMSDSPGDRSEAIGGLEHILVVEDDELVREHLCRQLQELGYRITAASHGAAALDVIRKQGDIDLLFTDVVMPGGMNGRELADTALTLRPALKVLFTSGYTENAIVHHGRLDPGVELLSKPYRRRDLASKVRKVLDA